MKATMKTGKPIPDTPHAVSVWLPTWSDNVGYEEGDPKIVSLMQSGYPRFVFHPTIKKLFSYCLNRFGKYDDGILILNSRIACQDCRLFIQKRTNSANIRLVEMLITPSNTKQNLYSFKAPVIYMIIYPKSLSLIAKEFWQHTGTGISSRFAEYCLVSLDAWYPSKQSESYNRSSFRKDSQLFDDQQSGMESSKAAAVFVEERFGRNLDMKEEIANVKLTIRKRIAGVLGDSNEECSVSFRGEKVDESLVFLFSCGMSSIYFAFKLATLIFPDLKSVQFGFPYTDTLKIQEKFGNGVHFLGKGYTQDLPALLKLLETDKISCLICEFPSNPLLESPPLHELWELANRFGFILIVDETIGNFVNTNLLPFCHILVSSLTKIFSGDSNVMGGSLVVNPNSEMYSTLMQKILTVYQDDLWCEDVIFLERNSRTFKQRIRTINENAEKLCESIKNHPNVLNLFYPKFTCNDNYLKFANNSNQKVGYGGLFSIVLKSEEMAKRFYDALPIHKGPSLGTNFTLACPYTLLAHYQELDWAQEHRVSPWLIRVSVGMEPIDWLVKSFIENLDSLC